MSVFLTNNELSAFAKNGINGLAIKNTIDAYRTQGLSDNDIRAKIDAKLIDFAKQDYGADNVDKARQIGQEYNENKPSRFMTTVKHLTDADALQAGAEGALVGTERMLNGATLGAYDWANEKLGGNAKGRAAEAIKLADEQGKWTGGLMRAGLIASDIGGGIKSPIIRGVVGIGKVANSISNPLAREVAQGALGGGALGGTRSAFDSDFDTKSTLIGAGIGGGVGAAIPLAREGVKYGTNFAKNVVSKTKTAFDKLTHNALSPSAEEMAAGAQEISGALPDNGELTGTAVKNLSDDITKNIKTKATALYDKAEQLASGRPVVLDKNSNFAKTFDKLSQNATKTGRSELNKVWNEVGHNKYDAPNYETAKSYRSWLSEKSATGGTGLTKKQYGDLVAALDKDIEASLGKEASAAKKAADAFYRNEMANPDSITNSVNKMLRNDPVSSVGNRAVSSAQGKAWKSSSLKKLIDEGEKIGSPYVADVKQALQANTTTRAQFNRMSPLQKQMVYGDKLQAAEKNFNGGISNWLEKTANKTIDTVATPVQRVLNALNPVPVVQGTVAGARFGQQLKNAANNKPVTDISMGKISKKDMNIVNSLTGLDDQAKMQNRNIIMPASTVNHIYDNRIQNNKITPKDMTTLVKNVLYGDKNITLGGNPYSLTFANTNEPSGYGIIIPNVNNTGKNYISNVIRARPNRVEKIIERNRLGGREQPPSADEILGRSTRFSALQPVYDSNINQDPEKVKYLQLIMSLVNALRGQPDKNKKD